MLMYNEVLLKRVDKSYAGNYNSPYVYRLSPYDADVCNMSMYLSQAIMLEVCTHPKPGLVTRSSNGSHKDMSILTFAMSSAVLSKAFYELQNIGLTHNGSPKELLKKIRAYGIVAEELLLKVTKGVNTQKGILFAGGILSAAAGYVTKNNMGKEAVIEIVKDMTEGIVDKELLKPNILTTTAGEKLFQEYGITGIRGEVASGFRSVVSVGLPALKEAFVKKVSLNDALVHTLLNLMTVVEDTNVVWRSNINIAEEVKVIASDILHMGSVFTKAGKDAINQAGEYFEKKNISPGGSADLLSVTIALYLLENKEFPVDIF